MSLESKSLLRGREGVSPPGTVRALPLAVTCELRGPFGRAQTIPFDAYLTLGNSCDHLAGHGHSRPSSDDALANPVTASKRSRPVGGGVNQRRGPVVFTATNAEVHLDSVLFGSLLVPHGGRRRHWASRLHVAGCRPDGLLVKYGSAHRPRSNSREAPTCVCSRL
jgi:hypothetical protein